MDRERLRQLHRIHRPENFRPRASTWYEIKNISAEVAVINLYDEIGLWGVTASAFIDDLHGVKAKQIELHISSPGGDVWDGLAIMNALAQHPAPVTAIVDGVAASAASFIAMAGDEIEMSPGAMMMIHEAAGVCAGNEQDMREMAGLLDKASQNIANIYARRAGGTPEDWRTAMRAESWYTDEEAVKAGLADRVSGAAPDEEPPAVEPDDERVSNAGRAAAPAPTLPDRKDPEPASFDVAAFRDAMKGAFA